jgi:uncharacterized protein (DUF2235 family)
MSKNIIICSDGTGNTAIKGRGTNVFKLFEAVDLNGHRTDPTLDPQIAFYDDGVGTEDLKPLRILGGAFGLGLARNVRKLYRELARVYDFGDRIFLFGFSRGAFTVRTLAGLIIKCGILEGLNVSRFKTAKALEDAVDETYEAYRAGYDSYLTRFIGRALRWPDRDKAIAALHTKYPFHPSALIAFIGVWDTVDAVGMPFALAKFLNTWLYQFKFPTQDLSKSVERACHALSIDDERTTFTPTLWQEAAGGEKRIEQVWFAGAHSNVGGGYPKQGMSLVTLDWMLRRAMDLAKLRVQRLDLDLFQGHSSVDDKLYDPRAGAGIFYRWAPRNIAKLCADSNTLPKLHLSAVERIAHGTDDYAPGNLPLGAKVVITLTGDPKADAAARARAEAVEKVLHQASPIRPNMLGEVARYVTMGEFSYWIFMASLAVLLAGMVGALVETPGAPPSVPAMLKSGLTLLGNIVSFQVGELYETFKALVASRWGSTVLFAVIGLVIARFLSARADARMSAIFSGFWHQQQAALRAALKGARGKP